MSRFSVRFLIGASLALSLAGTAGAATIATHVLQHDASSTASCVMSNLGKDWIGVNVRIFRNGDKILDFGVNVAPYGTAGYTAPEGGGQDRCVFEFSAPKKSVRGVLLVKTTGSSNTRIAAEAH